MTSPNGPRRPSWLGCRPKKEIRQELVVGEITETYDFRTEPSRDSDKENTTKGKN